jgi:preprotein translocase subunit SecY
MPQAHQASSAAAVPLESLSPAEPRHPSTGSRIWFTIAALMIYRLGTYIPLPGIDPSQWEQLFGINSGGTLRIHRMAIFALSIMPYISASILVGLMATVSSGLDKLKKEGERGRKVINQYTRYLTLLLAAAQSYGIAVGLEGFGQVVADPGPLFRLSTVITLTGGTMFLMWLGELITSRGVGNGIWLIVLSDVVIGLPGAIASILELGRQGALSTGFILGLVLMTVVATAFIVFMEGAQRRLLIQYPERQIGDHMVEGQSSELSLKLNTPGVWPPIVASSLLGLPTAVAAFNYDRIPDWFAVITAQLGYGRPLYLVLYVALIVFFTFFYTATAFDPAETAESLKKHRGFIPGIRPGEPTADYIDDVLSRITVIGAAYLAVVCVLPVLVLRDAVPPFYFGSTLLIIVISMLELLERTKTLFRVPPST